MNEFELIENIKSWLGTKEFIGDDAAVLPNNILTCVDTLVEDVHFTRQITSFYDLGWKALAVNISDIAAMGGISKYALISFAATPDVNEKDFKDFYDGFKALADLSGVVLVGGDTVSAKTKIVVSVTLIGEVINQPILRTGAKAGDYVYLTGTCGEAAKGLHELLTTGKTNYQKFNRPMPRFKEGEIIGKNQLAHSMIDVSDGLAFSLYELIKNTDLGIELTEEFDDDALFGGEDYELVFTSDQLLKDFHVIGKVTKEFNDVRMNERILPNKGYQAF